MMTALWTSLVPYDEIAAKVPAERLIEIDGQRVYVEDRGQGPALLLLHGFAASSYSFREIIPRLENDFRVVAVDLNGFGYTERPRDLDAYRPDRQVDLLFRVLDRLGIEEVSIAGHSYGTFLALMGGMTRGDRVKRVALISPLSDFGSPPWFLRHSWGPHLIYAMGRHLLGRPRKFRELMSRSFYQREKMTVEVAEAYRERLRIEGVFRTIRGYSQALGGASKHEAWDPGDFPLPVLVLAGQHDAILDVKGCRDFAGRFRDADFVTLEESGHSGPEEEPDEVAERFRGFFG